MPRAEAVPPEELDRVDRAIVATLQEGFPLCERPFLAAAATLGISEDELIARIDRLLEARALTRFGPLFQVERIGGAFVLAAMAVPEADFERTAAIVNAFPEVAHNYAREHRLNMWFVLATETPAGIDRTASAIEAATGYRVFRFPKQREYFVDLRLAP